MRQEIDRGVVGGTEFTVGQRVCIVGEGSANLVHAHGTVERFTKTQMIVTYTWRHGQRSGSGERRYRTGPGFGREVGAYEYGGTVVSPTCRRPIKKSTN